MLIVNGRQVVVIREGADPTVLREEGVHVMQSKDPKWAERVGKGLIDNYLIELRRSFRP